jgi:hypothetical protein
LRQFISSHSHTVTGVFDVSISIGRKEEYEHCSLLNAHYDEIWEMDWGEPIIVQSEESRPRRDDAKKNLVPCESDSNLE